tara:strand:- start:104 stop:355 length:252 start_codon:yes stop_codon:yes gene_type:complete
METQIISMVVILFIFSISYCIYLNLKLREVQEDMEEVSIDLDALEIKIYNKMMDVRREIKDSLKPKRIEKSRRRSTKRRRNLS